MESNCWPHLWGFDLVDLRWVSRIPVSNKLSHDAEDWDHTWRTTTQVLLVWFMDQLCGYCLWVVSNAEPSIPPRSTELESAI